MRHSSFFQRFQSNVKSSIRARVPDNGEELDLKQSLIDQLSRLDDHTQRSPNCPECCQVYLPVCESKERCSFTERTRVPLSRGAKRQSGYLVPSEINSSNVVSRSIRSCRSSRKLDIIASKEYLDMQIQQAFNKLNEIKEICQRRKSEKKEIISRGNIPPKRY